MLSSENNGNNKANNSLMRILKMLSTELPPSNHGTISLKDSMKINLFGSSLNLKSLSLNTNNSTKTYSRTLAILSPGPTSRLKEMSTLLDFFIFQKEPLTINFKSFMKKKMKSNSLSEEYWLMISSKTSCLNT